LSEIDAREIVKRKLRDRSIAAPDDRTKISDVVAFTEPNRAIEPTRLPGPEQAFPGEREVFLSKGRSRLAIAHPAEG
jgi:hypothetical protein